MNARTSKNGERLILSLPYSEDNVEFCRSLPGAKWDRESKTWSCVNTPAACWRITMQFGPEGITGEIATAVINNMHGLACMGQQQPTIRATDAWPHQAYAYWWVGQRHAAMLACDMATGKSKVAIDVVVNRGCKTILIICPKAVMAVWRREWKRHAHYIDTHICNVGTSTKKAEYIGNYLRTRGASNLPRVVVLNYDTARTPTMAKCLLSHHWDAVILDESHRAKGPQTATAKFVGKVGKVADFRLCLTGTPMPHSPLDLYGQFLFLDPGMYGTSWAQFRNRFAVSGIFGKNQIVSYKNLDELKARFSMMSYRVEAGDVLDLPPETHSRLECTLPKKAQAVYDDIQNELIAEIDGGTVTVQNALAKLIRLQQLTSGLAVTGETAEERQEHIIDTTKKDRLCGWLASQWVLHDHPVVVFCRWRHDLRSVREIVESLGKRYGELSGNRNDMTDEGMMPDVDLMAVQIQAGREGVDLTRSHIAVYYSVGFSLGDYLQSLARVNRPGQEHPVSFHHLVCEGTVDEYVYECLDKRRNLVEGVLEILTREKV